MLCVLHYLCTCIIISVLSFSTVQIVDFPVDHPSCSKQHSVLQYRLMNYVKDDGTKGRRVRLVGE